MPGAGAGQRQEHEGQRQARVQGDGGGPGHPAGIAPAEPREVRDQLRDEECHPCREEGDQSVGEGCDLCVRHNQDVMDLAVRQLRSKGRTVAGGIGRSAEGFAADRSPDPGYLLPLVLPISSFGVYSPKMDEVVFTRTGRGEPLVLIHGVGHRRQAWDPVVPLLAPHRDVIAVDLPGFGESPPHDGIYGLDPALAAFAKFFAEVGLDRPHVAGNSLGGLLSLALGEAGLVRSVTALSPAGLWTPTQKHYALVMLRAHRSLAKRLPDRVTRKVAATGFGRTLLAGMIFDKPWKLSPRRIV